MEDVLFWYWTTTSGPTTWQGTTNQIVGLNINQSDYEDKTSNEMWYWKEKKFDCEISLISPMISDYGLKVSVMSKK